MNSASALILAAAGVGAGHAVLPDHWLPLAVHGRARRDPLGRVLRRSLTAAIAHVLLSLLLGAVVIVVGLRLRSTVVRDEDVLIGGLLIVTGLIFVVLELAGRGHRRHEHGHEHAHGHGHGHDQEHGHHEHHHHDHDGGRSGGARARAVLALAV